MQKVENMQVQNDQVPISVRCELERIIVALEALRLFQAAAYASMAADCLDRIDPGRDAVGPAG
jgi:hypothetical protein